MGNYTIMVVDDSSPMRQVIIKTVKAAGYSKETFLEASNGKEALEILKNNWVDLLVTDYNMPDMDGLELLVEMKKDEIFASVPVLIITTEQRHEFIDKFMNEGASGYLKKPFRPEEIKDQIINILGERAQDGADMEEFDEGLDF